MNADHSGMLFSDVVDFIGVNLRLSASKDFLILILQLTLL